MAISVDKLRTHLKNREFQPVYVLFGEETFLRDSAASTISKLAFNETDFRDFNDDVFSLNMPDNIRTALASANQLPMMASRRVVRITEVRVSTSSMKDTLKEDAEDLLAAYLANPSPTSVVVFVVDELNGTRKLGKMLKNHANAVEFKALDLAGIQAWAKKAIEEAGATIDQDALRKLATFSGSNIRRINTEITKLVTASLPSLKIDLDLVTSLVRDHSPAVSFEYANLLLSGRKQEAMFSLEKSLNDGDEPLALLGGLAWKFRDELKRSDGTRRSAYSDRLAFALQRIAETDLAIKTSVGGGGTAGGRKQIEMLFAELAS